MQPLNFFPSHQQRNRYLILSLIVVLLISFYFYQSDGVLTAYMVQLRLQKLWAFALVAIAMSISTIAFQTIVSSNFLTPSILGMQSLYTFIQTVIVFFGTTVFGEFFELPAILTFLLNTGIMMLLYLLLWRPLQKILRQEMGILLLSGMVLGMLLSNTSQFMQLALDPNEFDMLQTRLIASFQNTELPILALATPLVMWSCWRLFCLSNRLDVFLLGPDTAHSLGVNIEKLRRTVFFHVFLLTAIVTALVGPLIFLGFMTANVTYVVGKTYKHQWLFILSALIGLFIILIGMLLVERVFMMQTTFETIVDLIGGIFFIVLLLRERKK